MKHAVSSKDALDRKALFVTNLHESTTKEDLESHFGGIGPLRHAFLVTLPGSSVCKGYGFVTFAFSEDAERAQTILNHSILKGRKITLDVARKRLRSGNEKSNDRTLRDKMSSKASGQTAKPKKNSALGSVPMRTVLLRKVSGENFAEEEAKSAVGAHIESSGFQACVLTSDGRQARCLYDSWSNAGKAAARAHGGAIDAVIEALKAGQRTKLIVRNLPFKVSEKELRMTFEAIAPIRLLRLAPPSELRKHDSHRSQKNNIGEDVKSGSSLIACAGYAFVEYFLVAHAQTAVNKLNGTKIGGRVIAVDMAISKSQYIAQSSNQEPENDADEIDIAEDAEEIDEPCDADKTAENEQVQKGESGKESINSGSVGKIPEQELERKRSNSTKSGNDQISDSQKTRSMGTDDRQSELRRTVFIRNLLFETSVHELRDAVEKRFGNVQKVLLVKHPTTGRPRGTAFVIFKDEKTAQQATGQTSVPESGGAEKTLEMTTTDFVLHGRKLLLSMAVDRSTAKDLKSTAPLHTNKNTDSDPRNLRLAWVGHITPDSKDARGLSPDDTSRRAKAEKEKKTKLDRNPNAFISEVRLSVRNLPRECDEKTLKQIFLLGAKENAKHGDEQTDVGFPRITHVKIVRDSERNDRSKGYGFVQFAEHKHAMQALLHLNNNPGMIEWVIQKKPKALLIDETRAEILRKQWKNRRLIVEFAVEDKRIVQVLERVREKGREQAEKKRKNIAHDDQEKPKRKKMKLRTERKSDTQKKLSATEEQKDLTDFSKSRYEKRFLHKRKRLSTEEPAKTSQSRDDRQRSSVVHVSQQQKGTRSSNQRIFDVGKKKMKQKKKLVKGTAQDVKFDRLVDDYVKKLSREKPKNTPMNKSLVKKAGSSVRWFEDS